MSAAALAGEHRAQRAARPRRPWCPGPTASPSSTQPARPARPGRAARTPRSRTRCRRCTPSARATTSTVARGVGGHQRGGEVAERPEVLGERASRRASRTTCDRRVEVRTSARSATARGSVGERHELGRRAAPREHEAAEELGRRSGWSLRVCVPRDSRRAVAARTSAVLTARRLALSTSVGTITSSASTRRGRGSRASRSTPASRVMIRCSSSRIGSAGRGRDSTASTGGAASGAMPRSTPVAFGPVACPATIASTARAANTRPSSSEFDARRFAPCTPEHAASPHAHRPGSVVAPSRSVHTPPER